MSSLCFCLFSLITNFALWLIVYQFLKLEHKMSWVFWSSISLLTYIFLCICWRLLALISCTCAFLYIIFIYLAHVDKFVDNFVDFVHYYAFLSCLHDALWNIAFFSLPYIWLERHNLLLLFDMNFYTMPNTSRQINLVYPPY